MATRKGTSGACQSFRPLLLHFLLLLVLIRQGMKMGVDAAGVERNEQELLLHDTYYTLHQDQTHVNLKINLDGMIEWDEGTPTLYSVFREQLVRSRVIGDADNVLANERTYTLEATATRYWVCMSGKGILYTIHQQQYQKLERQRLRRLEKARIRHETTKRTRRRWSQASRLNGEIFPSSSSPIKILPPSDCLFKTYEFNPKESYERSVGIYSSTHSNLTHGRFLSISPKTNQVRTYRKPFSNLHTHHHLKITQVPIRYLVDMVSVTRFGRGTEYNGVVRQCILHLLKCPNHQEKIIKMRRRKPRDKKVEEREEGGQSKPEIPKKSRRRRRLRPQNRNNHHFYKIIERCKRRAERTDKPPKCMKEKPPLADFGGGGGPDKPRITPRSRRKRRKSHFFLQIDSI